MIAFVGTANVLAESILSCWTEIGKVSDYLSLRQLTYVVNQRIVESHAGSNVSCYHNRVCENNSTSERQSIPYAALYSSFVDLSSYEVIQRRKC